MAKLDNFEYENRLGIIAYQLLMQAKGLSDYVEQFGDKLTDDDRINLRLIAQTVITAEEQVKEIEEKYV